MSRKLFRVTTKGLTDRGHYVVAAEAGAAYQVVRSFLDTKDWGFPKDRALDKVELVAEQQDYPECGTILHFQS